MPGHEKKSQDGPDPDPLPFLAVSHEMRRKDLAKPYDPKRSVWCPDGKGGFTEGLEHVDDRTPDKVLVLLGHENKAYKVSEVAPVNPPKFEKCEDMADLTYLNEASVFWNLKSRYQAKLIYTYSGLFCVVVNPYKRYPIYTKRVVKMYVGRRRNEAPPHLWAITETAYRNMLVNGKNQSMLITGESGAGKTENTKKVISYLAMVATVGKKANKNAAANAVPLEDQIVATNPILESYGNAKTSRNDNSSRFGKFIRIHFSIAGKLAGCDIKAYLFEKSRITQQQEVERSYHIFYQLLHKHVPAMKEKCYLTDSIYDYFYVSQGRVKVDSIDDNEELQYTDSAFEIIGFSDSEKWNCYKLTAAVMTMGDLKFKQKGRDEQCEPDATNHETHNKVAKLCGIDRDMMMKAFVQPKIKVGTEWVTKGQNIEQANNAVGGIARAIYHRNFLWLIQKCNDTLIDTTVKKSNYCSVLDIAGFEIFTYNGYEQLSINFVNEKLQQFFNHHMFVVEQEEYISQGIDWQMVDFGMDLAGCIYMFEKPMGIWSILEEESVFPKATDKSFEEKIKTTLLGKMPQMQKPQSKTDKNAHFAVVHYAGTVSYNVTGWLEKNKDPVNDTVVDIMKQGSNELLVLLWLDNPGQTNVEPENKESKKKKGGGGKTVASVFLVDLNALITTLQTTEPSFVRCIVPNTNKCPGGVDAPLIMHQLLCNGVLEGIRICMRGFPNRILYDDFKKRYFILARDYMGQMIEDKKLAAIILENTPNFDQNTYRLGHTKVFFRAGALAKLEDARDDVALRLIRFMQGGVRKILSQKKFMDRFQRREMLKVLQKNLRKYQRLRSWNWFILIQSTRPLVGTIQMEEELAILEVKAEETYGAYMEKMQLQHKLEIENKQLRNDIAEMRSSLDHKVGDIGSYHNTIGKATTQIAEFQANLKELEKDLAEREMAKEEAEEEKSSYEHSYENDVIIKQELGEKHELLEAELDKRNRIISTLNNEITQHDAEISNLTKEKKNVQGNASQAVEDLEAAEEKLSHATDIKVKLENILEDMKVSLENEKEKRIESDQNRRKAESDLRIFQSVVSDQEKDKQNLELAIIKKENELKDTITKLEAEEYAIERNQKSIRDYQRKINAAEDELENERQSRISSDINKGDLMKEHDHLLESLDEAQVNTAAQIELNKKFDARLAEIKRDREEIEITHECTMTKLRKKHQEAFDEMSQQVDVLRKMKTKLERDTMGLNCELADTKNAQEQVVREKAIADRNLREMKEKLHIQDKKVTENHLQLKTLEEQTKRITGNNSSMMTKLEDILNTTAIMENDKVNLSGQLFDAKKMCDNEEKEYRTLIGKFRTVEHNYDGIKEQYDDEQLEKEDVTRQLQKSILEANQWRFKYEKDALGKVEELEMIKIKLQARLSEAETTIETQNSKLHSGEQNKAQLNEAIELMTHKMDYARNNFNVAEKKVKQMDKIVAEWKTKADLISQDLSAAQGNCRNAAADLFRVKNGHEEAGQKLEEAKRENVTLSTEIKDINELISDGGRTIHEIEKQRKKLECEKTDLQDILGDVETTLEHEESKLQTLMIQVKMVNDDLANRLLQMDENFKTTKNNHTKAMETLQATIEQESKQKSEILHTRHRMEQDVVEIEAALNQANMKNIELLQSARVTQEKLKEKSIDLQSEEKVKDEAAQNLINSERKVHALQNSLEETKAMLDQHDRARRQAEQDLTDTTEHLTDLTLQNSNIVNTTLKLNSDINELKSEKIEAEKEVLLSEEKAKKFMLDAANLAEELRREQEKAVDLEKEAKDVESRTRELQVQVDEAETGAAKWGDKMIGRLDMRIRELELELDMEQRRLGDITKNLRKTDRGIKENNFRWEEGRKNGELMKVLVDRLQHQIVTYKKQIEEAEEIAVINLTKFRRAEGSLTEAEQRAELNEQFLAKLRSRAGSCPPHN